MTLSNRDKAIISDLNRFRVMDRNSIAEMHFAGLKNPITAANSVLLRLLRDGKIQRSTNFQPFLYFGAESQMRKKSQKIGHFLAILNVYKETCKLGRLETFLVEPKYGAKGSVEPDIFLKYRNTGFFIEVQKTVYSEKLMNEKLNRYIDLFHTGNMAKPFPHVLILSEQRYEIGNDYPFRVFQAQSFTEFIQSINTHQPHKGKSAVTTEIKIKIG